MQILIQERSTRALMVAIHAAAGNAKGIDVAAGWEMFPTKQERELPSMTKIANAFPVGDSMIDWAEVEARAEKLRAAS